MDKPQVVIFDLGKVLLDFDYMIASHKLAARSKSSAEEINRLINQSTLLHRFEKAQLTTAEFFAEFRDATGFKDNLAEFAPIFGDIFSPMQPMIDFQSALRKSGVPTYIFSNTNALAVAHITRTFPFFSGFSGYIYSFEHGVMKPEAKIYEIVEKMTGHRGSDILYIDDRAENVEGGVRRGWRVILQEATDKTLAECRKFGLPA